MPRACRTQALGGTVPIFGKRGDWTAAGSTRRSVRLSPSPLRLRNLPLSTRQNDDCPSRLRRDCVSHRTSHCSSERTGQGIANCLLNCVRQHVVDCVVNCISNRTRHCSRRRIANCTRRCSGICTAHRSRHCPAQFSGQGIRDCVVQCIGHCVGEGYPLYGLGADHPTAQLWYDSTAHTTGCGDLMSLDAGS